MSSKGVPISIAVFYFRVKSDENLNNSTSRRAVVINCVLHGFGIHFSPNNLKREGETHCLLRAVRLWDSFRPKQCETQSLL